MKYECPTCNELDHDLEQARARLAEVEAEFGGWSPMTSSSGDTPDLDAIEARLTDYPGCCAGCHCGCEVGIGLAAYARGLRARLAEIEAGRDNTPFAARGEGDR